MRLPPSFLQMRNAAGRAKDGVNIAVAIQVAQRERGKSFNWQGTQPGGIGHIGPLARPQISEEIGAFVRDGQQIEQTIVVVIHELCGAGGTRLVGCGDGAKSQLAIAER